MIVVKSIFSFYTSVCADFGAIVSIEVGLKFSTIHAQFLDITFEPNDSMKILKL